MVFVLLYRCRRCDVGRCQLVGRTGRHVCPSPLIKRVECMVIEEVGFHL